MRHLVFPVLTALSLAPITLAQPDTATQFPRPNTVYSIWTDGERTVAEAPAPLPREAFREGPAEPPLPPPPTPRPQDKIHPELWTGIATRPDEVLEVMIGFTDDLVMSRFPEAVHHEPMNSAANLALRREAEDLIDRIQEERDRKYEEYRRLLGPNATILERFWITSTLRVVIPVGDLSAIAEFSDVSTIEPSVSMIPPPSCCQVDDGRAYIGALFGPTYFGEGTVALLDTGVRSTHVQLAGRIGLMRDCVAGTLPGCLGGNQQPGDTFNHGTSSAAIIAATSSQGSQYTGVTVATINSFKVYFGAALYRPAVQRAFQAALANIDKVIVAEIQDNAGEAGTTTVAGDNAFDAGAVVIGAVGNQDAVSAPAGPGNGHKVIAAGARSLPSGAIMYQVNGPTSDGRIKPDLQGPTDTETASATADTALRVFTGTSGATPYLGAAAVHLRNQLVWFAGGAAVDPGLVYALLINSGSQSLVDDTNGAGPVRLDRFRWYLLFGSVNLTNGQQVEIPISLCGVNYFMLGGAIWWPEGASTAHRRMELSLIDPSGVTRATGSHMTSVFQKVQRTSGLVNGNWKLRIKALSVPSGAQQVYWSLGHNSDIGCGPLTEL